MLEVGYRVATREELLNMDFSVEQLERFKLTAQKNGEAHIDIPDLPGSSGQAWKRRGHHSYGVLRMKAETINDVLNAKQQTNTVLGPELNT